jgi:hypothetical protein
MRKLPILFGIIFASLASNAQNKQDKKFDLSNRANDHFMIQLSYDSWVGAPDSIKNNMKGLHRGANVYFMFDKPFRNNQRLSVGIGVGVGTSNVYFKNMKAEITSGNTQLPFELVDSVNNYKKYKLNTAFLELPLELRYSSKPDMPNKSIKGAIGIKVGTLLSAHTKQKNTENSGGQTIREGIWKEKSKNYFNSTRLAVTARFNYGVFGIFGSYSLTPMFKSGVADQDMRLLQVGLTITGL